MAILEGEGSRLMAGLVWNILWSIAIIIPGANRLQENNLEIKVKKPQVYEPKLAQNIWTSLLTQSHTCIKPLAQDVIQYGAGKTLSP